MTKFVYLAGPILGQTKAGANNWRYYIDGLLKDSGLDLVGVSPLRCEPLIGDRYSAQYQDERFGTPRAIMHKNMFDAQQCDMLLAYIPKPTTPWHHSWGTMAEMSWGKAFNKGVILVSDDGEIRLHPVLNAQAGWVLETLEEAMDVILGVLGPYAGGKNV